jgi:hypothetical protein
MRHDLQQFLNKALDVIFKTNYDVVISVYPFIREIEIIILKEGQETGQIRTNYDKGYYVNKKELDYLEGLYGNVAQDINNTFRKRLEELIRLTLNVNYNLDTSHEISFVIDSRAKSFLLNCDLKSFYEHDESDEFLEELEILNNKEVIEIPYNYKSEEHRKVLEDLRYLWKGYETTMAEMWEEYEDFMRG